MIRASRLLFLFLLISTLSSVVAAKDKLDGIFIFKTDSDLDAEEYVEIEGRLNYTMDLPKKMEVKIAIEASLYEVNPHELTFRFGNPDLLWVRIGYDENSMTMDEYRSTFNRPATTSSLITDFYKFQGFVARNIGIAAYHKFKNDDLGTPVSWRFKMSQSLALLEPQIEGGMYYHYAGDDSYIGGNVLYIPYFVNTAARSGDIEFENFFSFTLIAADYHGPLVYGFETAIGANPRDPIGLFPLPPDSDRMHHWGSDALVGWRTDISELSTWLVALRYSVIIPDLEYPEYHQQQVLLGNQLYYTNAVKFYFDTGARYTNAYGNFSPDKEWEWIWSVGIMVKADGISF